MLTEIVAFLVMLNPFALFLYLEPVMEQLKDKIFYKVLLRASLISLAIFFVFLLSGTFLFENVFRIDFEAFRIFGGIVIFSFAYFYIVKGHKALITMKENLDDLAAEIALPFMIGAGTISLTIIMGKMFDMLSGLLLLIAILGTNYLIIMFLKYLRDNLAKKKLKIAFDKNMEILLRLNGFFVGAIGVNMVLTGIQNIMLAP